jgi:hypothetical protein
VERHRFWAHFGQARVLHYLSVDFVTMRSRLEDDPRKNNGLVGFAVDQTRERYLTFDVEVFACLIAFPNTKNRIEYSNKANETKRP